MVFGGGGVNVKSKVNVVIFDELNIEDVTSVRFL